MDFTLQSCSFCVGEHAGGRIVGNSQEPSEVMVDLEAVILPQVLVELRLQYASRLNMVLRQLMSTVRQLSPTLAIWALMKLKFHEAFCRRQDAALESPSYLSVK